MKLNEFIKNDELLFHKVGLLVGAIMGVLIGGVVSKRADDFELIINQEQEKEEEVLDGPKED